MYRVVDFSKYENYIRVGHKGSEVGNHKYSCSDLENFPTPSTLGWTLHDLDKDAFTDLEGYAHRNRVRHDAYDIEFGYSVLSDNDLAYILNRVSPEWIYMELIDKKTKKKTIHKVYASDKKFDTFRVVKDENGNWRTLEQSLVITFVEE